jgi:hypothetical protein
MKTEEKDKREEKGAKGYYGDKAYMHNCIKSCVIDPGASNAS